MKKIIISVVSVIIILFLVSKVYYFIVINKAYNAVENFRKEENRYYSVVIGNSDQTKYKKEIFTKDNIVKYNKKKDEIDINCVWDDFVNDQEYLINFKNKNFRENPELTSEACFLVNLTDMVRNIYRENHFNIKQFLKIKYIIPIKYNSQKCYKIATNIETLIIDRNTYLPVYSCIKTSNSDQDTKSMTENIYEFKVGEVTDEDITLPDLTDFTDLTEKE